jgi:hypothetical protein
MLARWHLLVLALVGAASVGCAPQRLRDGVYHGKRTTYRLGPLGPAWQRHESQADLAFFQPQLDAMIMVNTECPAAHDPPLQVAANTLLIGFTDRQVVSEATVLLAGREALHRQLRAKLDGQLLVVEVFVLKKNDCLYDLVYLSPPETAARGREEFDRFVAGFETADGAEMARRGSAPP